MIDSVPVFELLILIAGPVLLARLLTGSEPVDLAGLVGTVTGASPVAEPRATVPERRRPDRIDGACYSAGSSHARASVQPTLAPRATAGAPAARSSTVPPAVASW